MNRETVKSHPQEISFESALLRVSHCLTNAELWAEFGSPRRANHLFHLAEVCALKSGYLELLSLVWSYDGSVSYVTQSGT